MPIVTALKPQKRPGYINLFLDGEFWCGLSDLQIITQGLHKGTELSDEVAQSLKELSDESKAYSAALRYLSFRIRSRKEISDHLKRKQFEAWIEPVLTRLEMERYINDQEFAERWAAMRQAEGKSPVMIRQELIKKGISSDLLEEVESAYDAEARQASLMKLIQKKQATQKSLDKTIAALQRNGWRYGEIQTALQSLAE